MIAPGNSFDPLLQHATDPAFVIDPLEDRFVAANPAGCRLVGYTRDQLLETPVSRMHSGELEHLRNFMAGVLRRGHGSTITLTCRAQSGRRLPIEMSLSAFEIDGRIHLLALIDDRSEHRAGRDGD